MVPKRMTEANEQEQKRPLTLRSGGTLGLRRPVETGSVRQSFSHGRSKQVTVEVRKKRVVAPGAAPVETARSDTAAPTVARAAPAPAPAGPARSNGAPRPAPRAAPAAPERATLGAAEPARRAAGVPRTL